MIDYGARRCGGRYRTQIDFRAGRGSDHHRQRQHHRDAGDRQYRLHQRPGLDVLAHRQSEVLLGEPESGVVDV